MAADPNIKIFVADDSGTMRVMFKQILKQAGFENIVIKPFDSEQIKAGIERAFAPEMPKKANNNHRNIIDGKVELTVAHIQITDHLVLGALKHRIENGEVTPQYFELKTDKKTGWNPIQEGLENGQIDCAFVLAPIAIKMNDLYPVIEDFDSIQRYMYDTMGIGRIIDLEQFIYTGFADKI